jgi:hypothetical protein
VQTTIDGRLQEAAQSAIDAWLPSTAGPHAALVAIHNADGEVRAMVGGNDKLYNSSPFNLATQGQRQPGSAFKPFVLAEALRQGISPNSTWASAKHTYVLKGGEHFTVNNYDDAYAGVRSLYSATTYSDNSVYAAVGQRVARRRWRSWPGTWASARRSRTTWRWRSAACAGRHAAGHGARLRDASPPGGLRRHGTGARRRQRIAPARSGSTHHPGRERRQAGRARTARESVNKETAKVP